MIPEVRTDIPDSGCRQNKKKEEDDEMEDNGAKRQSETILMDGLRFIIIGKTSCGPTSDLLLKR